MPQPRRVAARELDAVEKALPPTGRGRLQGSGDRRLCPPAARRAGACVIRTPHCGAGEGHVTGTDIPSARSCRDASATCPSQPQLASVQRLIVGGGERESSNSGSTWGAARNPATCPPRRRPMRPPGLPHPGERRPERAFRVPGPGILDTGRSVWGMDGVRWQRAAVSVTIDVRLSPPHYFAV